MEALPQRCGNKFITSSVEYYKSHCILAEYKSRVFKFDATHIFDWQRREDAASRYPQWLLSETALF